MGSTPKNFWPFIIRRLDGVPAWSRSQGKGRLATVDRCSTSLLPPQLSSVFWKARPTSFNGRNLCSTDGRWVDGNLRWLSPILQRQIRQARGRRGASIWPNRPAQDYASDLGRASSRGPLWQIITLQRQSGEKMPASLQKFGIVGIGWENWSCWEMGKYYWTTRV